MKKVFFLLLVVLLSNWATAQITDYSIFDKKFNFYVANDLGRNGYYDQRPIAELMGTMAEEVGPEFVVATGDIHHFEGVRSVNDPLWMTNYELIYQNTRRFVWSQDNPYFFKGKAGEGIGGPHIGYDMVWPMSIMMKAFTSQDDQEIKECIKMLMDTDAGTGFMHESFHKDDPANFTRAWFAWQNTLFGELILKLVNEGKLELLNSL